MLEKNQKPKILLILPPSTVYKGDPTVPVSSAPLGLAYIASYLKKHGYVVEILDAITNGKKKNFKNYVSYGLNDEEILKYLKQNKPDIVGITCMYTAYAGDAHRVARIVKEFNKNILVVFGGSHATIFPELTLKDKNIDMVVLGEGEQTLLEIVKNKHLGKNFKEISGTVMRQGNKVIFCKPRKEIENLNEIPFPAWELLPMEFYLKPENPDFAMRNPGMVLVSSRGCPGRCIYCSIHSVWGHTWRGRSPKNVVDEIEELVSKYKIQEIYFMDDSMGVSKARLQTICKEIINRKLNISWTVPNGIAHWTLDEETLDLMKRSGCYRITFGIESGNLETRRFIGKPYDLSQAKKMIKYANKIGMWTICTNIIGFPNESKSQIEDTVKFALDSDTDLAVFYLLCPHPGTQAYEIFKKEKLINLDYIFTPSKQIKTEEFEQIGRTLAGRGVRTNNFSEKELQQIVSDAYRTFLKRRLISFLNPLRVIRKIHSFEDFNYVLKIFRNYSSIIVRSLFQSKFSSQALRRTTE